MPLHAALLAVGHRWMTRAAVSGNWSTALATPIFPRAAHMWRLDVCWHIRPCKETVAQCLMSDFLL